MRMFNVAGRQTLAHLLGFIALAALLAPSAWAVIVVDQVQEERDFVTVSPRQLVPGELATIRYANQSWAGSKVSIHFGFNGWNLPLAGPGAGEEVRSGDRNHFIRREMRAVSDGTYEIRFTVPEDARAMHYVFCKSECGSGDWDNNFGADYSWPIVFPYIGPYLTWNERTDPATGIVIQFENSWESTASLRIWAQNGQPRTLPSPSGTLHRFVLTDLEPHTRYFYEVSVGGDMVSQVYNFQTGKVQRELNQTSFLAMADSQDNGDDGSFSESVAAVMRDHDDVDFIVFAGDLPWDDRPGLWWTFFDKAKPMLARYPIIPAIGNHDTPGSGSHPDHTSFFKYFDLPYAVEGEGYYQQEFGPVRFLVLDSERRDQFRSGSGQQDRWVKEQLAAKNATWNMTMWHVAPFNAGSRHYGSQYRFRDVTRHYYEQVDWHFSGHEHMYQRFGPIRTYKSGQVERMSAYGDRDGEGTGYMVLPPAGASPNRNLVDRRRGGVRDLLEFPDVSAQTDEVQSLNGFARIDIDGPLIDIQVFGFQRNARDERVVGLVDRVSYSKR